MVPHINQRDAVGLETFKSSKLGQLFAVDTSCTYKNGRANPGHLFEIFGNFSGHDAMEVRELMLEHIAKNLDFHASRSIVCLEMRNTRFTNWLDRIADGRMYCDELGLLSLSALYRRHTLVVTANKLWSTIEHPTPINLLELLNECSVKLIYLGQLRFGELKTHPRRPSIPMPTKSSTQKSTKEPAGQINVQTDIKAPTSLENSVTKEDALPVQTTEYVLHVETSNTLMPGAEDGHETKKLPENVSGHVETLEPVTCTGNVEMESPICNARHVETASNDAVLVETSPSKNLPAHSLNGRTCILKLKAISQLDIDVWCNNVTTYYRYNPLKTAELAQILDKNTGYSLRKRKTKADKTGISLHAKSSIDYTPMMDSGAEDEDDVLPRKKNKIRPHPTGPSQMVLQAHEFINRSNKTKEFYTKPVTSGPQRNEVNKNSEKEEKNQNFTSAEADPVETNKETKSRTGNVETNEKVLGKFVTKIVGIRRHKKERRAKCRLCGESFKNVKELNEHHRTDHDIQFCAECDKGFNTLSSLEKHKYYHCELKYACEHCGMGFPFMSRLDQHKVTHRKLATLPCMHKNCGCTFKNLGDLNRHVNQHNGIWYTCDFCTYHNKDKRNTNSRMKTHVQGNEAYGCQKCGKRFRFNTQYRRHQKDGCTLPPLTRSDSPTF